MENMLLGMCWASGSFSQPQALNSSGFKVGGLKDWCLGLRKVVAAGLAVEEF